jgi:hypothetical protein
MIAMSPPRTFKLFVPSVCSLQVVDMTGAALDLGLVCKDADRAFFRSKLPNLDGLTFTFPVAENGTEVLSPGGTTIRSNFWHMGDFFIVSGKVKDLFVSCFGADLEIVAVRTRRRKRSLFAGSYFAARISRIVDCIDAQRSMWCRSWTTESVQSFADGFFRQKLDERCWREYSNDGEGNYASYPSWSGVRTQHVQLIEDRIPSDALLFQARYWPGQWLIDAAFADRLQGACGYDQGFSFGTVDLNDMPSSYTRLMLDLVM